MFGLRPAAAAESSVLELGCGDGGNLLSLAQALPGARFVGIDAAGTAVERGNRLAREGGLGNVELLCMDLEELPEGDQLGVAEGAGLGVAGGGFDYVLSHGVYSWIPPRVRVALLAGVRRHLAPMGVAYVSYNAYPGSYLRDMARDVLGYHVRDISDPERKLRAAQELMQTIVAIEEPSPYAQVLREHMGRMLRYTDALLFHDDLAEISTPFYFHEFVEHAEQHRLAFLSEANLFESQMREVPDSAERLMAGLPNDVVVREQYLDFFKNRMFRQTLLCHADAPICRELDDTQVEGFAVYSAARGGEQDGVFETPEGYTMTSSEPLVLAAMGALQEAWPRALSFGELLERGVAAMEGAAVDELAEGEVAEDEVPHELVRARLRVVLLEAYLAQIVMLQGCAPPLVNRAGERPRASPLARAQGAAGLPAVSSLLHANVRLEGELEQRVLALLDGERDRAGVLRELGAGGDAAEGEVSREKVSREELEAVLERFAGVGLLAADG
ncbi:MAG TPA: class I SAM-dependent methyltransferase [Solirubrobacteraceae bacterium]